jgi:acyl-CoA synthetase (NDP forming)
MSSINPINSTNSTNTIIAQIDGLFHSRSIAIIGVPRGMKTGRVFLQAFLDQGFDGRIYPVNPRAQEIDGLKAYPRVADIPGPVDLAIVLVPSKKALAAVRECAAKGVKGAVLFTAGFSETGTREGADLEADLVRTARAAGMRLIGPNGMGLYCPETGLAFFPQASRQPGPVGMVSHSGSLTNILGVIAEQKGIRFSKVISSGNECDLTAADFLTYLAHDPATAVIGAYIEGIKNGPYFLQAVRQASLIKPVRCPGGRISHGCPGRRTRYLAGCPAADRGHTCCGIRGHRGCFDGFCHVSEDAWQSRGHPFRTRRPGGLSGRSL